MTELIAEPSKPVTLPELRQMLDLYRREIAGKTSRRVDKSDDLGPLVERLKAVCEKLGGAGLAAPQIGTYWRVAIARNGDGQMDVLVNPEIANLGGRDLFESEGCLSLPPYDQATARVYRSEIATIKTGTIEDPEAAHFKVYKGLPARIVQHEIDHLNGVFFIDHLGPVAKGIVLRRYGRYLLEEEKTASSR